MGLPNEIHPFHLAGAGQGYQIPNSLRFRNSASAYLTRTPGSSSGNTLWTYSVWMKRGFIGTTDYIIGGNSTTSGGVRNEQTFAFDNNDNFTGWAFINSSGYAWQRVSNEKFRDPSAWYHVVIQFDSTNATAANRLIVYVNNQQLTWGTSVDSGAGGDWTTAALLNINNNVLNAINGGFQGGGVPVYYGDAYMTECIMISGSKVSPSSFGQYDSITDIWGPKKYTGTYGTNGFYLPFKLSTAPTYAASFNGSSQHLSLTANSSLQFGTGDFTIEGWYYQNGTVNYGNIFSTTSSYATSGGLRLSTGNNNNTFQVATGGSGIFNASAAFQTSAWLHFALVRNSGTTTLYVNGVSVGSAADTNSYTADTFRIGWVDGTSSSTYLLNGLLSNFRVVKGTALYTTNFTPPTSPLTAISGTSLLTLQDSTIIDNSTNAFSITNTGTVTTSSATPFSTNVFTDASGNNNNWTGSGVNYSSSGTTYDWMIDSPTAYNDGGNNRGNYCTINPLATNSTYSLSNGNLTWSFSSSTLSNYWSRSTFAVGSGKWYWEVNVSNEGAGQNLILGIQNATTSAVISGSGQDIGSGYGYISDGTKITSTSVTSYANAYTANDVVGIALDMDNGAIYFSKNNTWQNSGDPTSGSSKTGAAYTSISGNYNPLIATAIGGGITRTTAGSINFGQRPFTYTPPTGYLALNTYNLANPSLPLV